MANVVGGTIKMVIGESADFLKMIGKAFLLARDIIRDWVLIWATAIAVVCVVISLII